MQRACLAIKAHIQYNLSKNFSVQEFVEKEPIMSDWRNEMARLQHLKEDVNEMPEAINVGAIQLNTS